MFAVYTQRTRQANRYLCYAHKMLDVALCGMWVERVFADVLQFNTRVILDKPLATSNNSFAVVIVFVAGDAHKVFCLVRNGIFDRKFKRTKWFGIKGNFYLVLALW